MRSAIVLVPEAGLGSGPDLTRYFLVCGASILAMLALAFVFRRTVARHLRVRASKRSLQVLDVLPLSGKQKLVVVRCYDRSFLLGVGDKELRSIAELELEPAPIPAAEPIQPPKTLPAFAALLKKELLSRPAPVEPATPQRELTPAARGLEGGIIA
jgi:flagellar biogenesis protein FliO